VPEFAVPASRSLVEFLVVSGVTSSNTQARNLISAGAVSVNGEKIGDVRWTFDAKSDEYLVKAGKRQWRRAKLR